MTFSLKAPAKINLSLEVLSKRNDGYHTVSSIMQTVSLYDEITFTRSDHITLQCNEPFLQNENNLVWQAASLLRDITGCNKGAFLELLKNIPCAAGLGGGSSDAAATLKGLNRLWSLGLTDNKLSEVAAKLGSDVPFFITGGCCMVEGRGEVVNKLPDLMKTWFVLIKPDLIVPQNKTRTLYSLLQSSHYSSGEYVSTMRAAILKGDRLSNELVFNTFDFVAKRAFHGLDRYNEFTDGSTNTLFHLSGSGPLLFSVFGNQADALAMQEQLTQRNIKSYVVFSLGCE